MARKTSRRNGHSFLRLIHPMLEHPNFYTLSATTVKLLIDIAGQYRGNNNGDLCATLSVMKKRGWNSNATITKHVKILIEKGFLIKTRQGGRTKPSLYAITWEPINICGGKLEVQPTKIAPNTWRKNLITLDENKKSVHRQMDKGTPPSGAHESEKVVELHRQSVHKP